MAYLNDGKLPQRSLVIARNTLPGAVQQYMDQRRTRALLPVRLMIGNRLRAQSSNITGSITKVEIIWNGAVVTQVPAGDHFDVRITFSANNPAGGNWTIAGTVIAPDGSNAHFDIFNVAVSTSKSGNFLIQDAQALSSPFVMPNAALTLRVTLWAYLYSVGGPDFKTAVPVSQW